MGLSPEKLGKEEYEKRMLSYVHDALEDANFHSANRQIFADLYGKPELAKRPDYSEAPEFGTPERDEWEERTLSMVKDLIQQHQTLMIQMKWLGQLLHKLLGMGNLLLMLSYTK